MKNLKLVRRNLAFLLFASFLHNSLCGICELCVCTQTDTSRIVNCEGKREIDNYTEIFDLLAFNDFNNVGKLIVNKHEIVSLPLDTFRSLKNLKSLDLSENSVADIEADVFKDLTNLEKLNFSFNRLSELNGAVFANIQSLLQLNLSHNLIANLNETTPNQLPNLTHLDISHNNLHTIESPFIESLSNLVFLDVSFNNIDALSGGAIMQLRSLHELRASDNALEKIPDKYFPESLQVLSVAHNSITSLPANLSQIRVLNIADNKISAIEADVASFGELEQLNLSGNALTDFPNLKLTKLKILDLSRNEFKAIPKTLNSENFPKLEELAIGGNPIKHLAFEASLSVQRLILRDLKLLERIEIDAFRNLKGIDDECVNLTVTDNRRLSIIEKGAFDNLVICSLDLSKNAFTRISPEVIKSDGKFVAKNGIDLQMNPFNCDCKAQWMLDDLVPHLYSLNPELLEDLRCRTPLELSGTRMVHWFRWKNRVFCDTSPQVLSRMTVNAAAVLAGGEQTVRLQSSRGMLAVIAGAMGTLCILIIVGILVARKIGNRRRLRNRRF